MNSTLNYTVGAPTYITEKGAVVAYSASIPIKFDGLVLIARNVWGGEAVSLASRCCGEMFARSVQSDSGRCVGCGRDRRYGYNPYVVVERNTETSERTYEGLETVVAHASQADAYELVVQTAEVAAALSDVLDRVRPHVQDILQSKWNDFE